MHKIWVLTVMLIGLLGASSCTRVNESVGAVLDLDTDVRIDFRATEDINPDEKHTPSPVVIRFYELQSDIAFRQADFIGLFEQDEELLGKDLISKRELNVLLPGDRRSDKIVVDENTRYVGLFAEFFEFRNAKYKLVFPVTSNNVVSNSVQVLVRDNELLLRRARKATRTTGNSD